MTRPTSIPLAYERSEAGVRIPTLETAQRAAEVVIQYAREQPDYDRASRERDRERRELLQSFEAVIDEGYVEDVSVRTGGYRETVFRADRLLAEIVRDLAGGR